MGLKSNEMILVSRLIWRMGSMVALTVTGEAWVASGNTVLGNDNASKLYMMYSGLWLIVCMMLRMVPRLFSYYGRGAMSKMAPRGCSIRYR